MAAKRKTTRTIAGKHFVPDLSGPAGMKPLRVWVGLLPDCPVHQADIGHISFVKGSESVYRDPLDPTTTRRIPVTGTIAFIDPGQIDSFVEAMSRQVIRVTKVKDDGTRSAKLIRIPSEARIATARELGARFTPYTQAPSDEPLARYAYFHVLEDQEDGRPGDYYPEPIEKVGIQVPDDGQEPEGSKTDTSAA